MMLQDYPVDGKDPIEWVVLDKTEDSIFVMSKYALDCLPYNKVFVNAKSTATDIPESVRNLFDYLTKKEVRDELTKRIDERVTEAIAHQKWRVEYMTYAVTFLDAKEEGRAEGQAKGIIQTLDSLVKDGILTVSDAAQRAGMTEEEFVQAAKQYALSEE